MVSILHAMHKDYSFDEFNKVTGPEIKELGDKLFNQLIDDGITSINIGEVRYSFWFMPKLAIETNRVRIEAQVVVKND